MDLGLAGKRAAVAAASSGLGFGSAKALAAEGVPVAICGRDRGPHRGRRRGDRAAGIAARVRRRRRADGASSFVATATEALGGVDILVTNAGGPPPGNFASTDVDAYPAALDLNLLSVVGDVQGRGAGDAGAAVGARRRHHVDLGAPADRQPDPVEHGPRRRHRVPEDAGPGGRRATASR